MTNTIPSDFAKFARIENDRELEERFGFSIKVIRRMRVATGISSPAARKSVALPDDFGTFTALQNIDLALHYGVGEKVIRRFRKEYAAQEGTPDLSQPKAAPIVGFSNGMAKQAADYLIRVKNCRPVYNMLVRGREFEGKFYVNNRVMTTDEMIEYAIERGFDPKSALG